MTKEKKYKKKTILFLLLLILFISLFAGLALIRQTQEVRRKAAYGEINLQLLPSIQEVELNEEIVGVQLHVIPESYSVIGGHFKLSYDPKILNYAYFDNLNENFNIGTYPNDYDGEVEILTYIKHTSSPPTNAFNMVTLNFKPVATGTAKISNTGSASFVGSRGVEGPIDRVLEVSSFSGAEINVLAEKFSPTPTETPEGWPELTFKIKFRGTEYKIGGEPYVVGDIGTQFVDLRVRGDGVSKTFENVPVEFDEQAVGTGSIELVGVDPGDNYGILVKGPVHLARRFCEDGQTEHCWLGEENISLVEGENVFDWTGLELQPGDINQDGVVNSIDFSILKAALGQRGEVKEDLNFNGIVDTQDIVIFLDTLSSRYEDEL